MALSAMMVECEQFNYLYININLVLNINVHLVLKQHPFGNTHSVNGLVLNAPTCILYLPRFHSHTHFGHITE